MRASPYRIPDAECRKNKRSHEVQPQPCECTYIYAYYLKIRPIKKITEEYSKKWQQFDYVGAGFYLSRDFMFNFFFYFILFAAAHWQCAHIHTPMPGRLLIGSLVHIQHECMHFSRTFTYNAIRHNNLAFLVFYTSVYRHILIIWYSDISILIYIYIIECI